MFRRLNEALKDAADDRIYNIVLVLLIIVMISALYFSSNELFIFGVFLSAMEIGLIYRFYLLRKNDENKKQ